jgi:uncharacterized repeat protein (TIGR04138 family)
MTNAEAVKKEEKRAERFALAKQYGCSTETYDLVFDTLAYAIEKRKRGKKHVSCLDMINGLRDLAFEKFGYLAHDTLERLGFLTSEDLGTRIFQLIRAGLLDKTARDRLKDFVGVCVYDKATFQPLYDKMFADIQL